MWAIFKTSPVVARLLTLQKIPITDMETKSNIIRIISALNKQRGPDPIPIEATINKSRYEGIQVDFSSYTLPPGREQTQQPYNSGIQTYEESKNNFSSMQTQK